jgi:hypothetical protein
MMVLVLLMVVPGLKTGLYDLLLLLVVRLMVFTVRITPELRKCVEWLEEMMNGQ